jgi:hypothetical protein
MKAPFVPLTANSLPKVQKAFVPKVLPPADHSPAPAHASPGAHAHAAHPHPRGEASIELKKEGDRVVGITVRCGCGEVIEIECLP